MSGINFNAAVEAAIREAIHERIERAYKTEEWRKHAKDIVVRASLEGLRKKGSGIELRTAIRAIEIATDEITRLRSAVEKAVEALEAAIEYDAAIMLKQRPQTIKTVRYRANRMVRAALTDLNAILGKEQKP